MTSRIAIVNRHPEDRVGGSEQQCDLLGGALQARGHDVTYLAVDGARAARSSRGYRVRPVAADPRAIVAEVLDLGPDVVYWRFGRPGLDVVAAELASEGIPLVLAVAHVDDVSRWPRRPLARHGLRAAAGDLRDRLAHRRTWRAFRHVAAVASQREDFLDRVPVTLQQHVPNVVDPTLGVFTWPRPYVAWVANLKSRKRPELLRPLAASLAEVGVDLLVAGGLQDARYADLAVPDPALPGLHPLGTLTPEATAALIAGARCLAVTARPEGLSNVTIQAWWHGVPTVSLDDDPDGAVAAHDLGVVCDGAVDLLLREVVAMATDGPRRDGAGARARAYAHERFDLERNVTRLEELLHTVARRPAGA